MTDDSGFGVPSTFGGVIPTPALDRIAKTGLRYTQILFHRALLADARRADHRPQPSLGRLRRDLRTVHRLPRLQQHHPQGQGHHRPHPQDNGYATSWFGKDHNTPTFAASQVGPFDQWPIGMGFEYFYGFVGGDTNQWQPNLFRNTTQIYPFEGKPGWNLTTAMADDAIDWLNRINQIDPSKPFFCYYVPGGTHAPHHPTQGMGGQDPRHAPVRRGLEQTPRDHLRQPEEARRDSAGRQADSLAEGPAEGVGPMHAGREEAVHPAGRGLRRLRGLHRPRDRPRHPGRRGHGQARQHAHHLHQRRQRHQRRGRALSARPTKSRCSTASTCRSRTS